MIIVVCIAAALAALIPATLVAIRHEVRLRRIRMIDALSEILPLSGKDNSESQRDGVASFEFVKAKYTADLDPPPRGSSITSASLRHLEFDKEGNLERYIASLKWWELRSNWAILRSAIPYMLICTAGFAAVSLLFLEPPGIILCLNAWGCDTGSPRALAVHTGTRQFHVFVAGFIGAFLFTVRLFVQAIAVFDLSAITVSRAALHILLNTVVATLVYGMMITIEQSPPSVPPSGVTWPVTAFWPAVAFTFGFVPDAGLLFVLNKAASVTGVIKTADARFAQEVRSTPLDVIDGIDFFIRFRLEEANITEVQSLACANPLMLFIETPYGLYQTVDWVSQAQLCTVVGVERFLMLRQINIRTIFDLERVMLGRKTTPALQQAVGGILLSDTKESQALAHLGGRAFASMGLLTQPRAPFADFASAATAAVARTRDDDGRNPSLEYLSRVILDDLHIHRLRQVWLKVSERIGRDSEALDDTKSDAQP